MKLIFFHFFFEGDNLSTQQPCKRMRTETNAAQKQDMCLYKQQHPNASQLDVSLHFSKVWGVKIGRSTVSDILRQKRKWLAVTKANESMLRQRTAKYESLEQALYMWFRDVSAKGAIINDNIMNSKAKSFGSEMNINADFKYSSGWLQRFKKRYGINMCVRRLGQAASGKASVVQEGCLQMKTDLTSYSTHDIYRMDETRLFYRLEPNAMLTKTPVNRKKKNKDHITVALCSNADGSHKLKPLVISKFACPRCFSKDYDPNVFCDYYHNPNAWMTTDVFLKWLQNFDHHMRQQHRHVILLVNNTSSHKSTSLQLTHVKIAFPPPNITSKLQAMDAGIIRNFKLHYRKHLTRYFVACINDGVDLHVTVRQALDFLKDAWLDVTNTTITNCWRHYGIQVDDPDIDTSNNDDDLPLSELRQLLSSLSPAIDNIMTAEDYVQVDTNVVISDLHCEEDIMPANS